LDVNPFAAMALLLQTQESDMRPLLSAVILSGALCAPSLAIGANYAPLECPKAKSTVELTICHTYSLGQDEARMATLFGIATSLVAMGQRGDIRDEQAQWLKTRDACGSDAACLTTAYTTRIAQLNKVIDEIASKGPY
jgi:uncharacterized protein